MWRGKRDAGQVQGRGQIGALTRVAKDQVQQQASAREVKAITGRQEDRPWLGQQHGQASGGPQQEQP
jgi:hypothetical protein